MTHISYDWYQEKLQFADTEENIRWLYLDLNVTMALTAKLINRPIADLSKYIWNHGLAAEKKIKFQEGTKEVSRISELRKLLQDSDIDHAKGSENETRTESLEKQFLTELGL
ncbi:MULTISPECIES: hypothetical protein [Clostridia]|uniref:hypothetical protein n=1 Tax=Clostridia TaxID=186801 RepID=UPI000E4D8EF8|nr:MULTISPECIES: hypothetical protein [Clostridia]RHV70253.1 hypothetical protein DXB15_08100 [Roseburia sp. OM02-15]